jgi:hypothetical protein
MEGCCVSKMQRNIYVNPSIGSVISVYWIAFEKLVGGWKVCLLPGQPGRPRLPVIA